MINKEIIKKLPEEEYKTLRTEILSFQQNCHQCIFLTIISTGAFLAIAFNIDVSTEGFFFKYRFLVPLVIIIPNMLYYTDRGVGIARIGMYIQVYFEEGLDYNGWETRKDKFLTKFGETFHNITRIGSIIVFPCLIFLCLCCFYIQNYTLRELPSKKDAAIIGLIMVITSIMATIAMRRFWLKNKYLETWRSVLREEELANTNPTNA